jgi:diaminopimelate decarboxylase
VNILPRTAAFVDGRLTVGGVALADVAAEFGTPAFVFDEQGLRDTAREYVREFTSRHPRTEVHFASKALPCAPVTRILAEEGIGCDVAGNGELAIALKAGFDPEKILLHGNAKSDEDIADAVAAGVGLIVIDNADDVARLKRLAPATQRVLVRINPDVPGDTHASVSTGGKEDKFGVPLEQAPALIQEAGSAFDLRGLHVHIGSQLLTLGAFARAAEAIAGLGSFPAYDLGGGLGIAYRDEVVPSVADYAQATVDALLEHLGDAELIVEPGRSMVGRSGVTLYDVTTVKRHVVTHVAVNGGMGDNLEPMLYGTVFTPRILDAERPAETCDVVGRHCESGDLLVRGAALATPQVGDTLVMPATGAYCYSLQNNYNGARKPPVVIVNEGTARLAVRRETLSDLTRRDC